MQKNEFVGVYGTLRQGERADLRKQSHHFAVAYICKDRVNGDLYHLGSYPGAKLSHVGEFKPDKPSFVVEVFRILSPSITALLDAYEGYIADAPETGLYNRMQTETERGYPVWVYTYNGHVLPEQKLLAGDWCKSHATDVSGQRILE